MELWGTRKKAVEMLAGEFAPQAKAIEDLFLVLDECIELFDKKAEADDFCRVCGLCLAKARNLALGAYGLILDGLGQEAGALIRPFIEYHELLTYFRLDPSRVQQAINDKLPSAGKRAQLIAGSFQGFREHLNSHASHSSFSEYSLSHLLDKKEMKIRKEQPMLPAVLFRNMGDFFVQLILLSYEAVNSLQTYELGYAENQADRVLKLREIGIDVFRLAERRSEQP
jgi:hypothetical protein